jgi:endonuclease YncB( thermonuclease family)
MALNLTVKDYQYLVGQITLEIQGLKSLVKEETVETYWQIGQFITTHLLDNNARASYGTHLYERLAQDVGIHRKNLERSVKFYQTYPNSTTWSKLTWSHYRVLIGIPNNQTRQKTEQLAIDQNWSVRELSKHIKTTPPQKDIPLKIITQLNAKRGTLYTYKILEADFVHQRTKFFAIDVGFRTSRVYPLVGVLSPETDTIIESTKKNNLYSFKGSSASQDDLYTYVAYMEKVIDGDTLKAHIDCGFDVYSHQSLRFLGIDTPERNTAKGEKAKKFVEDIMKDIAFIVIKTQGQDKYGRYLADIYYSKTETDPVKVAKTGTHLNQELLDKKLAVYM